jgi:hypothetical protein
VPETTALIAGNPVTPERSRAPNAGCFANRRPGRPFCTFPMRPPKIVEVIAIKDSV